MTRIIQSKRPTRPTSSSSYSSHTSDRDDDFSDFRHPFCYQCFHKLHPNGVSTDHPRSKSDLRPDLGCPDCHVRFPSPSLPTGEIQTSRTTSDSEPVLHPILDNLLSSYSSSAGHPQRPHPPTLPTSPLNPDAASFIPNAPYHVTNSTLLANLQLKKRAQDGQIKALRNQNRTLEYQKRGLEHENRALRTGTQCLGADIVRLRGENDWLRMTVERHNQAVFENCEGYWMRTQIQGGGEVDALTETGRGWDNYGPGESMR